MLLWCAGTLLQSCKVWDSHLVCSKSRLHTVTTSAPLLAIAMLLSGANGHSIGSKRYGPGLCELHSWVVSLGFRVLGAPTVARGECWDSTVGFGLPATARHEPQGAHQPLRAHARARTA